MSPKTCTDFSKYTRIVIGVIVFAVLGMILTVIMAYKNNEHLIAFDLFESDTQTLNETESMEIEDKHLDMDADDALFLSHLTIGLGVQKSGTHSVRYILGKVIDVFTSDIELHYFDQRFIKYKHDLDSFNNSINSFYSNGNNLTNFIKLLKSTLDKYNRYRGKYWQQHNLTEKFIFTKTPINILYPHIAYIICKDFIKYGVKLLVFLRNPIKRFISGYRHETMYQPHKSYNIFNKRHHWNDSIDGYLQNYVYNDQINGNNSISQFRDDLNKFYIEYIDNDMDEMVLMKIMDRYKQFLYFFVSKYNDFPKSKNSLFLYYFIWIRSCYAPQILQWIYYIETLNKDKKYKHSIKIIQSEQYFDSEGFHDTMNNLLCYIHFNIDNNNYNEWMTDCLNKDLYDSSSVKSKKLNSASQQFKPTPKQIELINNSYNTCNKWLYLLLNDRYSFMIMGHFNWSLFYKL